MSDTDWIIEELTRGADEPPKQPLDLRSVGWRDAERFSGRAFLREEPDVLARLGALAHRRGTTRAALIREAIRAFLDAQEDGTL